MTALNLNSETTPQKLILLLILALLVIIPQETRAAEFMVRLNGNGDFTTIQEAINASSTGDVIVVGDGTYSGFNNTNLDFGGRDITLRSQNGPQNCIISGGRPFIFQSGETSAAILDGFTLQNGYGNHGGAIYISGSYPTIVNNIMTNCSASQFGGAIFITGTNPHNVTLANNLLFYNQASDAGGGIYLQYSGLHMTNTTIASNEAFNGSGICFGSSTSVNITNNIIWGNNFSGQLAGAIYGTFDYNLIMDWSGAGSNFDGHPHFTNGPRGSHYLFQSTSDATDAGNAMASSVSYTTADGSVSMSSLTTNPAGGLDVGLLDLGFHHARGPIDLQVPGDFNTVQAAINAAKTGDRILLANGTHTGPGNREIDFIGKAITIESESGSSIHCEIDVQGSSSSNHRGFFFRSGEGPDSVLKNLTVTGGYAWDGGGVHCTKNSSPTIQDCIFTDNHSTDDGGGVFFSHDCTPLISGCTMINNTANDDGGGLYAYNSHITLEDCLFQNNQAINDGGGLYGTNGSGFELTDCQVQENTAVFGGGVYVLGPATSSFSNVLFLDNLATTGSGGGVYERVSSVSTFDTCTFLRNSADLGGGIYTYHQCEATFNQCTFTDNTASTRGGAMRIYTGSTAHITASLLWDNQSDFGHEIAISSNSVLNIDCSDVDGGRDAVEDYDGTTIFQWGSGNIDAFPYFCNVGENNLGLSADNSPCLPDGNTCGVTMGAWEEGCSSASAVDESEPILTTFSRLTGASPNPFNPRTTIRFELVADCLVELEVFDIKGHRVRNLIVGEQLRAGAHEAIWNGCDDSGKPAGAGTYFCRMIADGVPSVQKMALLK